ncbi:MAG TPA: amino acid adenylation domain-containing protein, partial [Symbiobacteriaceae bacterium]|nr:amino acid adenylation domain-containing protein [Symbiobacteriaceae bacterium]
MTFPQDPADRRAGLSASKQALLNKWLKGKQAAATTGEPGRIPRRPGSGPAPLSVMQQRLWFMEQLVPGTAAFNITEGVWLRGRLNVGALEQALSEIVVRHEALRSSFAPGDGDQPVVQVTAPRPVTLAVRAVAPEQVQALIDAEAAAPIDLATGPLYRFHLLRTAPEEHLLLFTLHHIVSDGWSLGVLLKELMALYSAFAAAQPSPLADLPIQYGDFAAWQRERLQGELVQQDLAWWKEQLGGSLPVLELPTDSPRPPVRSFKGAQHHFAVPPALSEAIRRICQREGLTPFMCLYAAWAALLHRYTGQTDILCGTPVANRTRAEVEGLIGFFVNTLVLRTDLAGDPSFRDLARAVREFATGAFAHQELPFEKLVEELAPQRSLSHQPLFQVVFNLLVGMKGEPLGMAELAMAPVVGHNGHAQFDLMLAVSDEGAAGFGAMLEYSTDLFQPETMARMAGHYLTLLSAAAADPECPVSRLPLLTPGEAEQLALFGGVPVAYPRNAAIHRLFAEVAALHPSHVALVWDGGEMTYWELDRRSNQLAAYLKRLGVVPETLVGIAAERSPELIVGLLGILKAGGAYVPLDPNYPAERLAFMLQDTGVPVLLTQKHLAEKLPPHGAQVVRLDADWPQIAAEPADPVDVAVNGDSLAYVIYTSGSTGRPKGAMVPHRGVVRLVRETNYAQLDASQVFLQLAPVSFDASTLEVWGALLNGARLALMPCGTPSLAELAGAIERFGVTIIWLTAGLFHLMVEQQLDALLQVRQILAGGDVLSVPHVRKVLERLGPEGRLINGYGPTENTTFTCCFPMTRETRLAGSVPIGRPVSHTRVMVADRYLQPVPVGVPGELLTGGDGLARGYLNRPELTAERFVESPWGPLYRTGDLVRWLPDGNIEFLGRL